MKSYFYGIPIIGKFIKTESRLVIVRDWEEGAITQEESSSHLSFPDRNTK